MDYRALSPADFAEIQRRKLAELEVEHASLTLELRLAQVAGIENDQTAAAQEHLNILDAQHAALTAWLDRPPLTIAPAEDEECPAS